MNILEKLKEISLGRLVLLVIIATLVAVLALAFFKSLSETIFGSNNRSAFESELSMGKTKSFGATDMMWGEAGMNSVSDSVLSVRNAGGAIPQAMQTTANTAEAFEVTEYSAQIETGKKKEVCSKIASLKPLDYVIFENADEADSYCRYTFKVKTDHKEEILGHIKSLEPKNLSESVNTIKKQVDDYTSEEDILKKQLEAIETSLGGALNDYDKLRELATQARDVESLAKIIDSKVNLIERLTQQRLNIKSQLDRLSRAKAEELDKLEYVFFSVSVSERKIFDWQEIKDSWHSTFRSFVSDVNSILQDISINLITVAMRIFQFALYLMIGMLVLRALWVLTKRIWMKKESSI